VGNWIGFAEAFDDWRLPLTAGLVLDVDDSSSKDA
jgi:hypothetical protein